jgi:hypothetical protein
MWVRYYILFSSTANLSFLTQEALRNIYLIPLVLENPRNYSKKQNNTLYRISPANWDLYSLQSPQGNFNSVLERGPVGSVRFLELLRREKICIFQSLTLRALDFIEMLGPDAVSHLSDP